MLTIILAAGESKRFAQAGYPHPKPLLPMPDGKTLLEWQILRAPSEDLLFVARKSDMDELYGKVINTLRHPDSPEQLRHRWIRESKGPLDTLWQCRSSLERNTEILIMYCDIVPGKDFLRDFIIYMRAFDFPAGLVSFDSVSKRFTHVPGTNQKCSGIFYFKNGMSVVNKIRFMPKEELNGIPDIVYKFDGWSYYSADDNITDIGVPNDYFYWMAEQKSPVDEKTWLTLQT